MNRWPFVIFPLEKRKSIQNSRNRLNCSLKCFCMHLLSSFLLQFFWLLFLRNHFSIGLDTDCMWFNLQIIWFSFSCIFIAFTNVANKFSCYLFNIYLSFIILNFILSLIIHHSSFIIKYFVFRFLCAHNCSVSFAIKCLLTVTSVMCLTNNNILQVVRRRRKNFHHWIHFSIY